MQVIFALVLVCAFAPAAATAQSPPLTLEQAVAEALRTSPRLHEPEDGRTVAAIRERQAAARFGLKLTPQFQAGTDPMGAPMRTVGVQMSKRLLSGASILFQADSAQFGERGNQFRDAGFSFGVSQPLFRGWTAVGSAELVEARRQKQAADAMLANDRQDLVLRVAEAYFAVVRAQRLIAVAEAALEKARLLHTASEARSRVGLATELDVLRAELLTSQSEAALLGHREARETAVDALNTLIGRSTGSDIEIAGATFDAAGPPPEAAVETLIATATATRIDAREARERVRDARRSETVAKWNLMPPLNLDLSYTRRGLGPGALPGYGALMSGFRFGLGSTYSLDRSDEAASAAVAAVSVRSAEREALDVERQIADDVRRAHRAAIRTRAAVDLQKKAVAIAERQLRLAQIRYERGVAGNFDVIDAHTALVETEALLIGAHIDRYLADLALRRASGLLDPEGFQP